MSTVTYITSNGKTKTFNLDTIDYVDHIEEADEWSDSFTTQDWDDIPDCFVCKDGIDEEFFDFRDLVDVTNANADVLVAGVSCGKDLDTVMDCYQGKFDNDAAFAENWYTMAGDMSAIPEGIIIDWAYTAVDLMHGFSEHDGYYFLDM